MNNSSIALNASVYDNSTFIPPQKIEPDTISYSSQFYAKNHIPSFQERPGNNTINTHLLSKFNPDYCQLNNNL
jgi:hypothetical protein